jgi:hypothetical protein
VSVRSLSSKGKANLLNCLQTCKFFALVCNDDWIWRALLAKRFGSESLVSVFHSALQPDVDSVHPCRTGVREYYPLFHTSKDTKREVCIMFLKSPSCSPRSFIVTLCVPADKMNITWLTPQHNYWKLEDTGPHERYISICYFGSISHQITHSVSGKVAVLNQVCWFDVSSCYTRSKFECVHNGGIRFKGSSKVCHPATIESYGGY